jgi:hypothetical protein
MISSKLNPEGVQKYLAVLVSLAFAFSVGSASAEIEVTENFSISGFLDMSSVISDDGHDTSASLAFDQFELVLDMHSGAVSAGVDLNTGSEIRIEQGWVKYTFEDKSGLNVKAGLFESGLGFETREPTGLYQYSHALGRPHAGGQTGVQVGIQPDDKVEASVSLLSGARDVDDSDIENPGVEAQLKVTPNEKITAVVGVQLDDIQPSFRDDFFSPVFEAPAQTPGDESDAGYTQTLINGWASLEEGPLTVAGELNILRNWGAKDRKATQFLGMANFSLKDATDLPAAVTVRFSGIKFENVDMNKEITVSPSILPADNWAVIVEFRRNMDAETTQVAVESLFTF